MADTIHKKKKSWPHFDKMYLSSSLYAEGYDRIFGRKNEEVDEIGGGRKIQKIDRPAKAKRRQEPKGARGVDRKKKVRQKKNG